MATRGVTADIGHGTTVTWNGDSFCIQSIKGPSVEVDVVESTTSCSTDGWKEFFGGLLDAGTLDVEINLDPNFSPAFGVKAPLTMNFPIPAGGSSGASFACDAILVGMEDSVDTAGKMMQTIKFKLSGKPTSTSSS